MRLTRKRIMEIAAIPDSRIDTSDIPEATESFFQRARQARLLRPRPPKQRITKRTAKALMLQADVLENAAERIMPFDSSYAFVLTNAAQMIREVGQAIYDELAATGRKSVVLAETIYEKHRIKGWMNVYTEGTVGPFASRQEADDNAASRRLSCVYVDFEERKS